MAALENAKRRGYGEICAGGMGNGGLEGGMGGIPGLDNSLQGFERGDLPKGYCDEGSLVSDTKSDKWSVRPGTNNDKSNLRP